MSNKNSAEIVQIIAGLNITAEERGAWEKAVRDLAEAAEALGDWDQMAEEPMNLFDPRFAEIKSHDQ